MVSFPLCTTDKFRCYHTPWIDFCVFAEVDYSKRFLLEKLGRSRDEKNFFCFFTQPAIMNLHMSVQMRWKIKQVEPYVTWTSTNTRRIVVNLLHSRPESLARLQPELFLKDAPSSTVQEKYWQQPMYDEYQYRMALSKKTVKRTSCRETCRRILEVYVSTIVGLKFFMFMAF